MPPKVAVAMIGPICAVTLAEIKVHPFPSGRIKRPGWYFGQIRYGLMGQSASNDQMCLCVGVWLWETKSICWHGAFYYDQLQLTSMFMPMCVCTGMCMLCGMCSRVLASLLAIQLWLRRSLLATWISLQRAVCHGQDPQWVTCFKLPERIFFIFLVWGKSQGWLARTSKN